MFCKNCGKEVKDDMKFCVYCGEKLSETVQEETAPARTPPERREDERKKSRNNRIWQKGLAVLFGLLHVGMFFALPLGKMGRISGELKAGYEYYHLELPQTLTEWNSIRILGDMAKQGMVSDASYALQGGILIFALPLALGLLAVLAGFVGKRVGSWISFLLSILALLGYSMLVQQGVEIYAQFGYESGQGIIAAYLISAAQAAVALIGCFAKKVLEEKVVDIEF